MYVTRYYLIRFKIGPYLHRRGKAASLRRSGRNLAEYSSTRTTARSCLGCFLLGQPGVRSPALQHWQHFDSVVVVPLLVGPVSADNDVPQRAGPSGERDAVSTVETPGPRAKTVSSKFEFDPFNVGASALVGVFDSALPFVAADCGGCSPSRPTSAKSGSSGSAAAGSSLYTEHVTHRPTPASTSDGSRESRSAPRKRFLNLRFPLYWSCLCPLYCLSRVFRTCSPRVDYSKQDLNSGTIFFHC